MIENEHQYQVALANRELILKTLETPPPVHLHPRAVAAILGAARLQLAEIEWEIRKYLDSARKGST